MGESIRSVSPGYVTLMQECVSVMAFRSPETGCVCVCLFKTDQEESHFSRRKETASNTNLRTTPTLEKCRVILTQIWVKYVRTQPLG